MRRRRILPYDPALVGKARRLRREATMPERLLWSRLRRRQLGTRFQRQRPIGTYIVDFFAPALGLVVEVDGRSHDAKQYRHDRERQAWLEAQGLHIVRISNDAVLEDVEAVAQYLSRIVEELHDH